MRTIDKSIQDELYSTAFRKKLYASIVELQTYLDDWIEEYNTQRIHSGKYCYGKTPMEKFEDAKPLAKEKKLDSLVQKQAV